MAGNFWQSSHYEQWIFEKTDLLRMRSEDLKIYSDEEYGKLMIFFSNLIQQIALEVQQAPKMRMQVIATACVFFKRFYAKRSFKDIDPFILAPTSIYLAAKVEEFGMMSTSKLMTACNTCAKKYPGFNQELQMRVGFIQEAEFHLIEIMDCCLIVFHAYRPLNLMVQDMKAHIKDMESIEADAWRVCNDSLRGDFGLLYPPHILATACLMFAALSLNREKDIKPYMSELCIDFEKVHQCLLDIHALYKLWGTFNEKEQLKGLLEKMPKPVPTPTQQAPIAPNQMQPNMQQHMQQQQNPQQQMQQGQPQMQQQGNKGFM